MQKKETKTGLIIDMGLGSGALGGTVIKAGTIHEIIKQKNPILLNIYVVIFINKYFYESLVI